MTSHVAGPNREQLELTHEQLQVDPLLDGKTCDIPSCRRDAAALCFVAAIPQYRCWAHRHQNGQVQEVPT